MRTGYYAWGRVKAYVLHVENFIKTSVASIPLSDKERSKLLTEPGAELELDFGYEDFIEITEVFPEVLRRSAFVFVMTLLETDLNELCEELQVQKGAPFSVYDIQGRGLERAATYIRCIQGLQITQLTGWGELRDLRHIRDMLVHANGRIRISQLNDPAARIARAHHLIDLVPTNPEEPESDQVILIKAGLAEYTTDLAEKFWNDLASRLPK